MGMEEEEAEEGVHYVIAYVDVQDAGIEGWKTQTERAFHNPGSVWSRTLGRTPEEAWALEREFNESASVSRRGHAQIWLVLDRKLMWPIGAPSEEEKKA